MSVGQRLKYLLNEKRMKNIDLARRLNTTTQSVSNWLADRNQISTDNARRICEIFPDVSFDWLMNGYGEMIRGVTRDAPENCQKCIEKNIKIGMLEDTIMRMEMKVDQLNREIGRLNKECLSDNNGQAHVKING
jgi:transcriptional regulator with XRE-family HTH domain